MAELFGVLAINKPAGQTSRDVVNKVQRLIRPTKVGHTGTLDPLATGILLLAIGKATRLVEFAHLQDKSYEADFLLGHYSDTLDVDGKVQPLPNAPLIDQATWLSQMMHWRGRIRQTPPQYSACKVDGRPAYELARAGVEFELTSREVTVFNLDLLRFAYPQVTMSIRCSSGTYIRSLGNDIAAALGTNAVMSRLVRTTIGHYALSDCIEMDQLDRLANFRELISSPIGLVDQLPKLTVSQEECQRLSTGSTLEYTADRIATLEAARDRTVDVVEQHRLPSPIVAVNPTGQLVAILEVRQNRLQPTRVFI